LAQAHRRGLAYLYLEQPPLGRAMIATGCDFPSQAIRRVIANHLGAPDSYDWKTRAGLETILATISRLRRPLGRLQRRTGS
jgi:hypothetical protein